MDEDMVRRVIGAALEVYRQRWPGLREWSYAAALARELSLISLVAARAHQVLETPRGEAFSDTAGLMSPLEAS